ncbi:putative fungal specific transcription factor [Lyophyllum shimeji]|uniref:Fungal specific transcription factor n=1 Tax=Lyophyllum shimeji TaxID=47721 RepID=A0A9P3PG15_LYOSH|nr:putative fungal specific transcription factor [Lyophyllum shimeji]
MDTQVEVLPDSTSVSKTPVVRGARACTVCRAAKMKCVGAEDGQKQCQRCKRANVECVFEKHRRGRKPGSKLSEASKMLRRLEKGLNSAKMKSQTTEASNSHDAGQDHLHPVSRHSDGAYKTPSSRFPSKDLPPLDLHRYPVGDRYAHSSNGSRLMDIDDEDDAERNEETIFPEKLIRRENERNSFFRTILNPEETPGPSSNPNSNAPLAQLQTRLEPVPPGLNDPITAGIISEDDAKVLFDLIFLRLNPFINLFDPVLHSVTYVRSKCPFLFTTLIMAGCKFFKAEHFKQCQKLANDFAYPNDNRTWTYIGYACRMAVDLGLNRYVASPSPTETEFQMLERRNRERTYLVLFVHDRSLSTQTGRHWMLPEDDFIRHSTSWHEKGGTTIRPEDVIVASFVSLRRIAAEYTEILKDSGSGPHHDVNYDVVLGECNAKLTQWADNWQHEMDRAGGTKFHSSILRFWRLYVTLFLNRFGISPSSGHIPSLQAISQCCDSALESLRIVSRDFVAMGMLRYGQDSTMMMSAFSAVSLLRMLRSPTISSQLHQGTAHEIHTLISQTAQAYDHASGGSSESTSTAYHARFLQSLIRNEVFASRRNDQKERHDTGVPVDPRLQAPPVPHVSVQSSTQIYPPPVQQVHEQFQFPASPHLPAHPPRPISRESEYPAGSLARNTPVAVTGTEQNGYHYAPQAPQYVSELDAHYWKNMFIELGFGENGEGQAMPQTAHESRGMPHYMEPNFQLPPPVQQQQQSHVPFQQHMHHSLQSNNYGHQ